MTIMTTKDDKALDVVTDRDIFTLIAIAQVLRDIQHWEAQSSSRLLAEFTKKLHDAKKALAAPQQEPVTPAKAMNAVIAEGRAWWEAHKSNIDPANTTAEEIYGLATAAHFAGVQWALGGPWYGNAAPSVSADTGGRKPFGYFHELLNHEGKGTGIWLGCAKQSVVEQSHIEGETGKEIVPRYVSTSAAVSADSPTNAAINRAWMEFCERHSSKAAFADAVRALFRPTITNASVSADAISTLRDAVIDAADEWSRYVEVDNAPRQCSEHIGRAFDAALTTQPKAQS